jgi:hypothetical protein
MGSPKSKIPSLLSSAGRLAGKKTKTFPEIVPLGIAKGR